MLCQRVSRERDHLHRHVGPQRQAHERLVKRSRVRCRPDATIGQLAGHPPDRPQDPGLRQGGSPLELCLQQGVTTVIFEIAGKPDVDRDEKLHGRDDTGPTSSIRAAETARETVWLDSPAPIPDDVALR